MPNDRLARIEGHVRRGEYIQAVREAEQVLLLPDVTVREMGRVFRLIGNAKGQSGDPYGALKVLELAITHGLKAKDWDCVGLARGDLGVAWLTVGDLANAVDYLQAFFLDLVRYDDAKHFLGHAHYNLGLTYRRRKEPSKAIKHYTAAVELFTERGMAQLTGKTHQNLAWLYCHSGRPDDAERELTIAETFSEACGPGFQAEQLVCRALYLQAIQRVGEAMALVEEVLRINRPGCGPGHKGYAAWIAGTIAIRLRHVGNAEHFAKLAIRYALEARDPAIMSQVSGLRVEIARQSPKNGEAAG